MTEQERFESWAAEQEGYGTAGNSPDWSLGAVQTEDTESVIDAFYRSGGKSE
jgi:hypothetical protein